MRILITGGAGQLGSALGRALAQHDVRMLNREAYTLDRAVPDGEAADLLVHCAALTDTQRCERQPYEANQVNAKLAERIATWAHHRSCAMLLVSTNEVFDGRGSEPYAEESATGPVNVYGASKLLGERLMVDAIGDSDWRIVRTSWLYGDGGANFVSKVLAAAREGRPLRFVTDEIATPTSADDLAQAIRALIEADAPSGIYHLTNVGEASRYDWAREIVRLAGLDESRVEPIMTAELRAAGYDGPRKPPYSVLANTRARAFGITMRPWREALAAHFERSRFERDRVAADG